VEHLENRTVPATLTLGGSGGVETDAQNQTFTWMFDDPNYEYLGLNTTLTQDGNFLDSWVDTNFSVDFDVFGPGVYELIAEANYTSGNPPLSATRTVTVVDDDDEGPTITLGGSGGTALNDEYVFTWAISDPSGLDFYEITLTLDEGGGPNAASGYLEFGTANYDYVEGTYSFNVAAPGIYTISVWARDGDGEYAFSRDDRTVSTASLSVIVGGYEPPTACGPHATVYVNDDWANLSLGDDPDGAGPAHELG